MQSDAELLLNRENRGGNRGMERRSMRPSPLAPICNRCPNLARIANPRYRWIFWGRWKSRNPLTAEVRREFAENLKALFV